MSIAQIESTIKSGGEELESIKAQITDNRKSIDDKKNEIGNIRLSQSDAGEEIKRIEKQAEQALADKIRFENEASRLRNSHGKRRGAGVFCFFIGVGSGAPQSGYHLRSRFRCLRHQTGIRRRYTVHRW